MLATYSWYFWTFIETPCCSWRWILNSFRVFVFSGHSVQGYVNSSPCFRRQCPFKWVDDLNLASQNSQPNLLSSEWALLIWVVSKYLNAYLFLQISQTNFFSSAVECMIVLCDCKWLLVLNEAEQTSQENGRSMLPGWCLFWIWLLRLIADLNCVPHWNGNRTNNKSGFVTYFLRKTHQLALIWTIMTPGVCENVLELSLAFKTKLLDVLNNKVV